MSSRPHCHDVWPHLVSAADSGCPQNGHFMSCSAGCPGKQGMLLMQASFLSCPHLHLRLLTIIDLVIPNPVQKALLYFDEENGWISCQALGFIASWLLCDDAALEHHPSSLMFCRLVCPSCPVTICCRGQKILFRSSQYFCKTSLSSSAHLATSSAASTANISACSFLSMPMWDLTFMGLVYCTSRACLITAAQLLQAWVYALH